jgi:hypothetical protein
LKLSNPADMALVFANVPFKLKLMWKSARSPCKVYVTSY